MSALIVGMILVALPVAASGEYEFARNLMQIRLRISTCEVSTDPKFESRHLALSILLGPEGGLRGPIRLLSPRRLDSAGRRLFRVAGEAIKSCAAYPSSENGLRVVVSADASGLSAKRIVEIARPAPVPYSTDVLGSVAVVSQDVSEAASAARPDPAPLYQSGTRQSEDALSLSRPERREIQRRLLLLGYDPNGIDGLFGPGTRGAISSWQTQQGYQSTGFIDRPQLKMIKKQSDHAYRIWFESERAAPKPRPNRASRGGWYRDKNGMYCKGSKSSGNYWCQIWKPRGFR